MNQKQTNRVTMFKATSAYLDDNNSVWSVMAPFVAAVQELKDKISAIDETAKNQETPTSGAAADKSSARDALEDALFLTCQGLGVLATTANDNDLSALTSVSPAGLQRLNDEELSHRATSVLEKANAKKTDLATLNVTQANIDELSQALVDFEGTKEKPRNATATRVAETESLADLVRDASGILRNKIDRMVNLFSRSNSKFVAGYRSARVVVDRPATHASPKPPTPPTP